MVPQPFPHLDGSGWVRIELRVVAPYLAAEAPEHVPPRATDLIPAIRHTTVARPSRTIKNTRQQGGNLIAWLILFALHAGAGA